MADQWDKFPDAPAQYQKASQNDPWAAFPDVGNQTRPVNSSTTDPASPNYVYKQEAPNRLERIGRGAADVVQGITQKALQAEDVLNKLLGPAVDQRFNQQTRKLEPIPHGPDPTSADYTDAVKNELAIYNRGMEGKGFDGWRALGSGAMSLPLGLIGGGASATTASARALIGLKQGATAGFLQFDPKNSLAGTGTNTLIGGATGAVVAPIVGAASDKVSEGARWLFGRLRGAASATQPMTDADLVRVIPAAADLSTDAKGALLSDAQDMIRKTGGYDAEQLARKANLLKNGFTPLRSMITRNPSDWTMERNLQKLAANQDEQIAGIGSQLTNIYQSNDKAGVSRLQSFGSGLPSSTQEGHGQTIINSLDQLAKSSQGEVSKVYDAVRQQSGDQLASDARQLSTTLDDLRDNAYASKLVDSVTSRLKRLGMLDSDGKLTSNTLTVSQSEELRKFVNKLPNDYGKSEIIRAIDADVIGGAGADAFQAARQSAQTRFGMLGNASTQKALDAVGTLAEGQTARRFVESQLISGSDRDVASLVSTLKLANDNGSGLQAAKAGTLQWIESKAVNPNSGQISGAQLSNALRTIGDSKLVSIFGQKTTDKLKSLAAAALDATYAPPYSAVNNANTAPMLLSLTQKARMIPGVPLIISEETQKAAARAGYSAQLRAATAAAPTAQLPQVSTGLVPFRSLAWMSAAPILGGALANFDEKANKPRK